jgi:hypothetical protein
MTTLLFDTHAFVKKLKEVGFSEEQTEMLTELQKTTVSNTLEQTKHDYELDDLATKRDLKELELITKRDIREAELRLELKIEQAKADLTRWIITVGILQVTVIAALIMRLTGHA